MQELAARRARQPKAQPSIVYEKLETKDPISEQSEPIVGREVPALAVSSDEEQPPTVPQQPAAWRKTEFLGERGSCKVLETQMDEDLRTWLAADGPLEDPAFWEHVSWYKGPSEAWQAEGGVKLSMSGHLGDGCMQACFLSTSWKSVNQIEGGPGVNRGKGN